jgi:hypothetical protein
MLINHIYVFIALTLAALFLCVFYFLRKSKKKISLINFIFIWPMIFNSKSSPSENKFVIFGILVMIILIGLSFLINK